ncbi:MAG TPA: CinA family protein [Bacteroidaceae bacterium]|nr:CinA family protein [Bacteroidaceae bacterium]
MNYKTEIENLSHFLHRWFLNKNKTLAVAESCTGGSLSAAIVANSGCSAYFLSGIVAYSDKSKIEFLEIDPELISHNGAVSRLVVEAMAQGVKRKSGSDFAVTTTGIIGPGGGSYKKPVGTVWIGVCSDKGVLSKKINFIDKGRKENSECAVFEALSLLKEFILDCEKV